MRAGSVADGKYVGVSDGGILHTLNYDSSAIGATIYGARVTLNLLGDGYIEAIGEDEIQTIAKQQATSTEGKIRGEIVYVSHDSTEGKTKAVGRFGWKAQHASVENASADALLNELGVPNRICRRIESCSKTTLAGSDELDAMVEFIRSTEPIAPDPERIVTKDAQSGSKIFDQIGCSMCHLRTLKTAPPGTRMPGSEIVVSERLGNKEIHPYSDYLVHDIGTGDGIIQNVRSEDYRESTRNKFRTAPLWGLRYRLWMMHDGKSITYHQAIMRHRGEALDVTLKYAHLSTAEQQALEQFLGSL